MLPDKVTDSKGIEYPMFSNIPVGQVTDLSEMMLEADRTDQCIVEFGSSYKLSNLAQAQELGLKIVYTKEDGMTSMFSATDPFEGAMSFSLKSDSPTESSGADTNVA